MEEHVKTLEALIAQKLKELDSFEKGWQMLRRHNMGGEGSMRDITIEKANELRSEIRELNAVADAIRPTPPVRFQPEVKS